MKVVSILLSLIILVTLVGCSDGDVNRIHFETNGDEAIPSMVIEENRTIQLPTDLSKDGYVFLRWYMDENLQIPFTEYTLLIEPVDSDITVYPKWITEDKAVDNFDNWDDYIASLSDESVYLVYLFSDTCPACRFIKSDTRDFTKDNAGDLEVIWIPVDDVLTVIPMDTVIPTFYVVVDNEIEDTFVGVTPILEMFESVESGSFRP